MRNTPNGPGGVPSGVLQAGVDTRGARGRGCQTFSNVANGGGDATEAGRCSLFIALLAAHSVVSVAYGGGGDATVAGRDLRFMPPDCGVRGLRRLESGR